MNLDTLKLSKRLQAAQMPKAQADAVAEALNDSLKESPVTTGTMGISNPKEERQLRNLRRVQIALFILIWGTFIAQVVFIIFFRK